MGAMASQITVMTIVCSTVYSGADLRKHPSSALLALCNAENVSIWWRHHAHRIRLTYWHLGDWKGIWDEQISRQFSGLTTEVSPVKLPSNECQWTPLMISLHCFISWRHQTVSWANVDRDLCRHIASMRHDELLYIKFCTNELLRFQTTYISKMMPRLGIITGH